MADMTENAVPEAEAIVPVENTEAGGTPQNFDELKDKASKSDEYWDRLVRMTADFDNYKKRAAREKQDAIKYANESLLERLIPVLDNFDSAIAAAGSPAATSESLKTGVRMIYNQ